MDRFLMNTSPTQLEKDDTTKSSDNKQHLMSETPYLTMSDFSASSLNHKTGSYTTPHNLNSFIKCTSKLESYGETKLVRKKGRPPKAGKQVADSFNCNVCNKTFNNSSALVKHNVTHSAERKFVCSECPKTFKRQDHLSGHMLTHSDVKPFICQKCDKSYCDSRSLKRHVELYHPSDCNEIMIPSSQADSLLKHSPIPQTSIYEPHLNAASLDAINLNSIAKDFCEDVECLPGASTLHLCGVCGLTFKSMQALNGHLRFHTTKTLKKDDEQRNSGPSNQDFKAPFHDSTSNIESNVPFCFSKNLLSMQVERSPSDHSLHQDKSIGAIDNFSASLFTSTLFPSNINSIASTFSSPTSCSSSGIENLREMESILFVDNQPQTFILKSDLPHQSYSMQLQNLTQNIESSPVLQQQQCQQFSKILNFNQDGQNYFPSLNQRHNPSYSLLHSLLLQKNDKHQMEQTDKKFPSSLQSEDINFEGLGLDSEGIEKLLVQSAIQDTKEEHVHSDENSIPEDLRNIPTHALQLFSISSSSRSDTPPPILDRLGNEIRTDDILNQEFSSVADEYERGIASTEKKEGIGTVLLTYDDPSLLNTSWNESLINNEIFSKILNISKIDPDLKDTSDTSRDEILEERSLNISSKAGCEKLEINKTLDVSSYSRELSPHLQKSEKFRNPGLLKMKRRHWPGPLIIPPSANAGQHRGSSSSGSSNFAFQSRLRSPRIMPGSGSFDSAIPPPFNLPFVPYTPPPMLSPVRNGSGLFCLIQAVLATQTPPGHKTHKIGNSPDLFDGLVEEVVEEAPTADEPLASDIKPHINEGPEYQATIPDFETNYMSASQTCDHAEMLWDPCTLQNIPESEVKGFIEFSSCAAIPFNGCNKELAHHILYLCSGDIKEACLAIMDIHLSLPTNHFVDNYKYSETSIWTPAEIEKFNCSLLKNSKDFFLISKEIGSKSCKECIEFYYLWKKVCVQESAKLKSLRRKSDNIYNNLRSKTAQQFTHVEHESNCSSESIPALIGKSSPETEPFHFQFASIPEGLNNQQQNIKLSFKTSNSKRQGRPKVGNKGRNHPKLSRTSPTATNPDTSTIFPCKICKKVFYKVKSRSAHMKTHRFQTKKPPPSPPFAHHDLTRKQIYPHNEILLERDLRK